jgi:hypothetical protein
MAAVDERARAILARTEALTPAELRGLHGALRGVNIPVGPEESQASKNAYPTERRLECVHVGAFELRAGARVRLLPRKRADIFDLALENKTATIETIEQDLEGRIYLAVSVDDDPGKDLAARGQPGHRFYFTPDEVVPLP